MTSKNAIEVSIVMPCLNEEKTLGICIKKAKQALKSMKVKGEVVIADNGSTDCSVSIARSLGARVVHQPKKGYGNAYQKGLSSARGKYIVMADSDNTYDFLEAPRFIDPLRQGYDMVMGTRLKGKIMPDAMPWLHRRIGNPFLSWFLRFLFKTDISDAHCGMRSFTKSAYLRMRLKTPGMEFASEMVINAAKAKLRIKEIPITLYAMKGREPHLHSFRDGRRHLRFMALYSPYHLFFIPGVSFFFVGIIFLLSLIIRNPFTVGGVILGPNTAVLGSFLAIFGFTLIFYGYFAKLHYFRISHFDKPEGIVKKLDSFFSLKYSVLAGLLIFLLGFGINVSILLFWFQNNFGSLAFHKTILSVTGLTIMLLGMQISFNAFLIRILKMD